ncbi:MAG: tRNA 2-methylthio-N6-isopentenyl adenosine(37) hydroxylase MiaE-like protein [Actinobacteria bacterium]|nr:tRNA 2-methylthio-N6-isopentenyl adenosine(37) hydroxylase MiaE-like protein [Actinomycetota bacterium]
MVAFFRLSGDAALAPSLADKAALAEMAAAEFGHFRRLRERIAELSGTVEQAMLPFVAPIDAFHARTAPTDWLESLVKAYVGDGIAADFYRAVAELLDPRSRDLVLEVLADTGHADFAVARVRAAIAADPAVAGRLALWARRLVGEALAQAHWVAAHRAPLAALLMSDPATAAAAPPDAQTQLSRAPAAAPRETVPLAAGTQGSIGRMFARLTDEHDKRMAALGLTGWERPGEEGS